VGMACGGASLILKVVAAANNSSDANMKDRF
jgi:hypothetical protein